jgi:hypothetical protein
LRFLWEIVADETGVAASSGQLNRSEVTAEAAFAKALRLLAQARRLESDDTSFAKLKGFPPSGARSSARTRLRALALASIDGFVVAGAELIGEPVAEPTVASAADLIQRDLGRIQALGALPAVDRWLERRTRSFDGRDETYPSWADAQRARYAVRRAALDQRQASRSGGQLFATDAGASPIRLWLSEPLWDRLGATTTRDSPLAAQLEAATARLRSATGVHLSIPTIAAYPMAPGARNANPTYLLVLGEVQALAGQIPLLLADARADSRQLPAGFCPGYRSYLRAVVLTALRAEWWPDPRTGSNDGAWVDEDAASRLRTYGVEPWSIAEFIARHVEVVLAQQLASFVGYGVIMRTLTAYASSPGGAGDPVARRLLEVTPDGRVSRQAFIRVVQALVREGVPIVDLHRLLAAFGRHCSAGGDRIRLIEAVRLELRSDLPGTGPGWTPIILGADLEEQLATDLAATNGGNVLAVPSERTTAMLDRIGSALVGGPNDTPVVVVAKPALRPLVARLVATENRLVPTVSAAELGATSGNGSTAAIAAVPSVEEVPA